jgi:hypothetical protein
MAQKSKMKSIKEILRLGKRHRSKIDDGKENSSLEKEYHKLLHPKLEIKDELEDSERLSENK